MSISQNHIRLGVLTRPHGVAGGLRCRLDHPGAPVVTTPTTGRTGYSASFTSEQQLVRCEPMGQEEMLCFFAGRTSREEIEEFIDMALWLPRETVLYGDHYGTPEVIGLEVVDAGEQNLGRIVGILRTAGHPVWEVRHDDHEWLLPAVDAFVREVDPTAGVVRVDLIPGLYERTNEEQAEERDDGE